LFLFFFVVSLVDRAQQCGGLNVVVFFERSSVAMNEEPSNPVPARLVRRWNEYYLKHKKTVAEVDRENSLLFGHSNHASRNGDASTVLVRSESKTRSTSEDTSPMVKAPSLLQHSQHPRKTRSRSIVMRDTECAATRAIQMVTKGNAKGLGGLIPKELRRKSPARKDTSTQMNVSAAMNCNTDHERRHYIDVLRQLGNGRAEYCRAVKKQYRHLFEKGLLGRQAFRDLNDSEGMSWGVCSVCSPTSVDMFDIFECFFVVVFCFCLFHCRKHVGQA